MMLAEVRRLRPSRAVVRAIRVVVGLLVIGVLVVEGVALAGHWARWPTPWPMRTSDWWRWPSRSRWRRG